MKLLGIGALSDGLQKIITWNESKLKKACRKGLATDRSATLATVIFKRAGRPLMSQSELDSHWRNVRAEYEASLEIVFSGTPPPVLLHAPSFGSPLHWSHEQASQGSSLVSADETFDLLLGQVELVGSRLPLDPSVEHAAKRVLCVIASHFTRITFCPFLPDLVVYLLLICQSEYEVFDLVSAMLHTNSTPYPDLGDHDLRAASGFWFPVSSSEFARFTKAFSLLVEARNPSLHRHLHQLHIGISAVFSVWCERLFMSCFLPSTMSSQREHDGDPLLECFQVYHRFFDCWIFEGQSPIYLQFFSSSLFLSPPPPTFQAGRSCTEWVLRR